jgi:putative transposase
MSADPTSMSQSLAKILIHTVFSTKDRRPYLRDEALRGELHRYLGGILLRLDCQPIIVGGVEDHVHLLSTLSRTCAPAEMVKEVKRGSSLWLKRQDASLARFAWQKVYGVTAPSPLAFRRSPPFSATSPVNPNTIGRRRFRMSFDGC